MISLPDKLCQHLAILLKDARIASEVSTPSPTPAAEEPIGIVEQIAKLGAPTLGGLAAQAVAGSQPDVMETIAKLAALRDQGVITAAEFDSKKTELLGRL